MTILYLYIYNFLDKHFCNFIIHYQLYIKKIYLDVTKTKV